MPADSVPEDPLPEAHRQWVAHGWGEAADGMVVVTSVMRVQQLLLARCEAVLAPWELTFARYELLALVSFTRHGELPLGKAGARLQVHPASVTNAAARLENQGLLVRVPHPGDRRSVLARVTSAGRRVVGEATPALNEVFCDLGLGTGQARNLRRLLGRVRASCGDRIED